MNNPQTFGETLYNFSLTVDIVEPNKLLSVRKLIEKYLVSALNMQDVWLSLVTSVNGEKGLTKYRLGETSVTDNYRISDRSKYASLSACCFDSNSPIWVMSKNRTPLVESGKGGLFPTGNGLENYWPGSSANVDAAEYRRAEKSEEIKTSIIVPIKRGDNRICGVLSMDSMEVIEYSEDLRDELERVAKTVSTIQRLSRLYQDQQTNTEFVIKQLEQQLDSRWQPKFGAKPKVFFAFSNRADTEVKNAVKDLVGGAQFSNQIELVDWTEMSDTGLIQADLLEKIRNCKFGICYLSEPSDTGDFAYQDNHNVLFESGMFHGRGTEIDDKPGRWIPIRERNSPQAPFDFSGHRTLTVPRDEHGQFEKTKFITELTGLLDSALAYDESGARSNF